jgi:hypothetical protein
MRKSRFVLLVVDFSVNFALNYAAPLLGYLGDIPSSGSIMGGARLVVATWVALASFSSAQVGHCTCRLQLDTARYLLWHLLHLLVDQLHAFIHSLHVDKLQSRLTSGLLRESCDPLACLLYRSAINDSCCSFYGHVVE